MLCKFCETKFAGAGGGKTRPKHAISCNPAAGSPARHKFARSKIHMNPFMMGFATNKQKATEGGFCHFCFIEMVPEVGLEPT